MKTIKLATLFFLLLFVQKANSQNYQFLIDPNFSSISSAESLSSLHRILSSGEQAVFPNSIGKKIKSKWIKKPVNLAYRFSKLMLLEVPIDGIFRTTQHLIFGYGYQLRNIDYSTEFKIGLPFPYGRGWWKVSWNNSETTRRRSSHEFVLIYSRAIEAEKILINTISKEWILSDSIHYREAMLTVRTFNHTHYPLLFIHDIGSSLSNTQLYLSRVNSLYGFSVPKDWKITPKHLRRKSLLNFLNPFVGFAFLTSSLDYGWHGKTYGKLRWFKFGKIRYLPSFRIGLTPFGDETYFESFFKKNNKALRFYYRHGNPVFEKFNGFGIETFNAFNLSGKIKLDFQLDIWSQPELQLGGETIRLSSKGLGNLMKINFQIRLFKLPQAVYLSGQFGYKTDGYIEGEPLSKGIILRGGFVYDFIKN